MLGILDTEIPKCRIATAREELRYPLESAGSLSDKYYVTGIHTV